MTSDFPNSLPLRRGLVIVPAYNESASIAVVVDEIATNLPHFDIVVIDDGSSDGTAECVPTSASVVTLPFNLGIGGAMQTGYRYAARNGYDIAIQIDGDGQHPAEEAHCLLERLARGDVDFVIGSRFVDGDRYGQTRARATGAALLRGLLRLLGAGVVTDCTSGFRVAGRPVIEAFSCYYPDDYPEPEVVLLLSRAGYRISEVPVSMRHRSSGRSSIGLLCGIYYVIKVTTALLLASARRPWRLQSAMQRGVAA